MAWFWQLRGRLMGGVFVIMAPPGEGKSYVATAFALELMRDGVKVYSNFPILSVDGEYCSYEFDRSMMKENLNGCAVFIDEGYTMFSSRKYMTFSDEDHDWFATSGHNEMMIFIIVQNVNRVDKVIREVLNLLYVVKKTKIPILEIPLWFTVDAFLDVDDLKFFKMGLIDPYSTEHVRFSVDVALAYDTKFFRKDSQVPYVGKTWKEVYAENGYEFVPVELNALQRLKYRFGRRIIGWLHGGEQWLGLHMHLVKRLIVRSKRKIRNEIVRIKKHRVMLDPHNVFVARVIEWQNWGRTWAFMTGVWQKWENEIETYK